MRDKVAALSHKVRMKEEKRVQACQKVVGKDRAERETGDMERFIEIGTGQELPDVLSVYHASEPDVEAP